MNRLKYLREEKNLYQKDMAKLLGVTSAAITQYETGKRDMSTDILKKLASYFNVSVDYLLGNSDIRNIDEIKNVKFANYNGLDTQGLDKEDIEKLQRQIDYIKKMKGKK